MAALASHFLGAVVVKQLPNETGDPERHSVIDGQQRLTTLQLVLDAAQRVMDELIDRHLGEHSRTGCQRVETFSQFTQAIQTLALPR